jgi:HEAT repeat protein
MATLLHVYADGELPAGDRTAVEEHLADCPTCAAEGARTRENSQYLQEVMAPFRMPPDFDTAFLFALPKRTGRAPEAARVAPKTVVLGGVRRRRSKAPFFVGGAVAVVAVFALWRPWESSGPVRRDPRDEPSDTQPGVRPPRGVGPADPTPPPKKPPVNRTPSGSGTTPPLKDTPVAPGVVRSGADLVAEIRKGRPGGYGPAIQKGWAFLIGTPAEAAVVRDAAQAETSDAVKAALVTCLGFDGSEDSRSLVRGFLGDSEPGVRMGAILALARSHSFTSATKRPVSSGPPLGLAVEIGVIEDASGRSELASLLGGESETSVRQVLIQILGVNASDPDVRAKLIEGLGGAFGPELVKPSLLALKGVQDPSVAEAVAAALGNHSFPEDLRGMALDVLVEAGPETGAAALAGLISSEQDMERRRKFVEAMSRVAGPRAEQALREVATSDNEPAVRTAAVYLLSKYPTEEVLAILRRVAQDDSDQNVRQTAETSVATVEKSLAQAKEQ